VNAGGDVPTRAQERAARDARVLELRRAGATFDAIARTVGLSNRGAAKKAFDRALAATGGPELDREKAREQEVDRIDRLLTVWWPRAMKGEVDASREVRQYIRLRAYLLGLALAPATLMDAPPEASEDGDSASTVVQRDLLEQRRRERDEARRKALGDGTG